MLLLHCVLSLVLKMKTWMDNLDALVAEKFAEWTAYRSAKRRSVRLRGPEDLEARDCPSTTWIAHGPGDWSNPSNWDNGVPSSTNDAVFDPNKSYYNCTIDVNTANANVIIQNGYTAQFFVNPGITWSMNNFQDNNPSEDSFNAQYKTSGSSGGNLTINGTAKFYNMGISDSIPSAPAGSTTIASTATVTMGDGSGYNIDVEDAITDLGTWNIGAMSGGGASDIIADDQVDPAWTIDKKLTIYSANQAATLANAKNGDTYIKVATGGEADFVDLAAVGQTMKIGLLEAAGTVIVTKGSWDFTQSIPEATLKANGATKTDDIYVIGGTFQLGQTGSGNNVTVSYTDGFEVQGSANSGAIVKVSGGNGAVQNLIPDNRDAIADFEVGTLQFDDYNEQLKLGWSYFAPNNGNSFQINMYANCGAGKTQDEIIAVLDNDNPGILVFGTGSTVSMYLKNPGTDTEATGTFEIIDDTAYGSLPWSGKFIPVAVGDKNNDGAGGIFTYTH